mmetsp:Transcript_63365/g.136274  ORF Transcript_63365/g.136274 Transcript_63365/m.136274 type:complete len:250 (-) Transcript_63365:1354-2103(-)
MAFKDFCPPCPPLLPEALSSSLALSIMPRPALSGFTALRSSSARARMLGSMVTAQSFWRQLFNILLCSFMSMTSFWMFLAGLSTWSVYCFLHARTSAPLKVGTSSRSLGPVPLGKWRAMTSRHLASLLPRLFKRRIVAAIHFRLRSTSSLLSATSKRSCISSSWFSGCHLGPRSMFSAFWFLRTQVFQNSGVLTRRGAFSAADSSGNNSAKVITASLSVSKSLKRSRSRLKPVISCQGTPILFTPSANS